MKKLSISILAIIFTIGISFTVTSCGDDESDANAAADEAATEEVATTDEAGATDETATEETTNGTETETADYSAGEAVYKSKCMSCHQENGEGLDPAFPGLKGKVANIEIIVNGKDGTAMAAFKDQLSDQELVDVINYVNHSWGNNSADIGIDDVTAVK